MASKLHSSGHSTGSEVALTEDGLTNAYEEAPRERHHDSYELRRSLEEKEYEESLNLGSNSLTEMAVSWQERKKWWKVYALHFLFMWNSRTYEFVSIYLIARAFPGTLRATSIRGILSTVMSMLCASAIGNWVDKSPLRLSPLLMTLLLNSGAILLSWVGWLLWPILVGDPNPTTSNGPYSTLGIGMLFTILIILDVVHDLSSIGNRLSVERDLIPVLVAPSTEVTSYGLTQINAVMIRLEMACQLIAPSLLPLVVAYFNSRTAWLLLLCAITIFFFSLELLCIVWIFRENREILLVPKEPSGDRSTLEDLEAENQYALLKPGFSSWPQRLYVALYQDPKLRLKHYFSIPMWPASIAIALLQLTVLAYSATLITYLLEIGFSLSSITVARASGSILGLASTIITPWIVGLLRKRNNSFGGREIEHEDDEEPTEGRILRRVGFWGVSAQFLCMVPVVLVLWNLSQPSPTESRDSQTSTITSPYLIAPLILFTFLSLSRVGHYMIQLMVQELGQVEIPASQRSTFAGTEQSFRSLCELCHWAATIIFSQPSQFRWLALGSLLMIGSSMGVFGVWSRRPIPPGSADYQSIMMDDLSKDDGDDDDD